MLGLDVPIGLPLVTVDPEARHTRKSPSNRKDGYRAHLVGEPDTGLITDAALTQAAGPDNADAAVAQQFLARTGPQDNGPQDVEPAEGSDGRDGRWRIARRVAPERVISTVALPTEVGPRGAR